MKVLFLLGSVIYFILTALFGYRTFIAEGQFIDLVYFIFSLIGVIVFYYGWKKYEVNY